MTSLVNFFWKLFKWAIGLSVIAALVVGGYLYLRLDQEIERFAEHKLAEHYRPHGVVVEVGSARFVPGRGVTLFDVAFTEGRSEHLRIDELTLEGRFDMQQLLSGAPQIDRVVVRRPMLQAIRQSDGRWNCQTLLPPPKAGDVSPPTEIIDATLVVRDATNPAAPEVVVQDANARLVRSEGRLHAKGAANSQALGKVAFDLKWFEATGGFELSGGIDGAAIRRDMLAWLPKSAAAQTADLEAQGVATVRFTAMRADRDARVQWKSAFQIARASVGHPKLPAPATNLAVSGDADPSGIRIHNLQGELGRATFQVAGRRDGWAKASPMQLRGGVTNLAFDQSLYRVVPPRQQALWRRFRPKGFVDAAGKLTFDGQTWRPDITADVRGLSIEDSEKFPYRLTGAKGTTHYVCPLRETHARFQFKLHGQAEGRPVGIDGEFFGLPCPGDRTPQPTLKPPCPVGWVEINAPRLRVTDAMIAGLRATPTAHKIALEMKPRGEFAARWRMERPTPQQFKPSVEIDITATNAAIDYARFPYPLDHIRGKLTARNGVWEFKEIECREANGPRVIGASGSLKPVDGRSTFHLRINATAAALDEQLKQALQPEQQNVWSELRPTGRVNFTAIVDYVVGDSKPNIALWVQPHERSVSIRPTFFPYQLDRIDGKFQMADGRVWFSGGRAEHGRSLFAADGAWTPTAGGWQFQLDNLHADRLDEDHDFRLAAPLALRRVIDELQPDGDYGLHDSRLTFTHNHATGSLRSDWDIQLDCHQTDINWGVRVEGVTGGIRLAGYSEGDECEALGEVQLDTLFWQGMQLTNVRGPVWINKDECRLGRQVAGSRPGVTPINITADAYGGKVGLAARVLHTSPAQYQADIGFREVELGRFTRDWLAVKQPMEGQAEGELNLRGAGSTVFGMEGDGKVEIRNANLYQLPLVVSLLKVLRNRQPNTNAFEDVSAEFTLQGEHLTFTRLDLLGDAVSLYGRGEASLDKRVNLVFQSIVGRFAGATPVLKSLIGSASEQLLRIRVAGTVDAPEISGEALPAVNNVLEQLRADFTPQALSGTTETPEAAALRRTTR